MPDISTLEKEEIITNLDEQHYVILHNDDKTPMDFVVFVLIKIFNKNMNEAINLTLKIHNEGDTVIESYPSYEIAEQKVFEVKQMSEANNFPLRASVSK